MLPDGVLSRSNDNMADACFSADPPRNQVDTLLINTHVNSEGSKHSLCRRVGVQHELISRGITTPHTLMTDEDHLH